MSHQRASQALAKFTVLDLTRVRSGPTCVRQLADWGANVIKIDALMDDAGGEQNEGKLASDWPQGFRGLRCGFYARDAMRVQRCSGGHDNEESDHIRERHPNPGVGGDVREGMRQRPVAVAERLAIA